MDKHTGICLLASYDCYLNFFVFRIQIFFIEIFFKFPYGTKTVFQSNLNDAFLNYAICKLNMQGEKIRVFLFVIIFPVIVFNLFQIQKFLHSLCTHICFHLFYQARLISPKASKHSNKLLQF